VLGSIFASASILIIGWEAGSAMLASQATSSTSGTSTPSASTPNSSTSTNSRPSTSSGSSAPSDSSTTAPTTTTPGAAGPADGTVTGELVNTRFGPVQVSVTISGGEITDVTALKLTDADGRSVQISNRAAPLLREAVLASQSANVSNVSGATYTTQAYLSSVQSALDQAGF
jgi:uncharacterized protein with FMN-binding domain